jgi:hypothetical protein
MRGLSIDAAKSAGTAWVAVSSASCVRRVFVLTSRLENAMTDIPVRSKATPVRDHKYSRDVAILVLVAFAAVALVALAAMSIGGTGSTDLVLVYPPF